MPLIEVQHLRFEYPGVIALDDVSFELQAGEITGLVGPNGAGKTTLLRSLAALEQPISGTIILDGIDVLKEPRECHRKIGYLSDFYGLYRDLSVYQCLKYMAYAQDIDKSLIDKAIITAAERLHIGDRLQQKAGTLSRGLSQRLAIAQAIIHEPKIILLDEPASGLDPEARRDLSLLFLQLQSQGMSLVVSSHILAELDEYCSNMLMVRQGKVIGQQLINENDGSYMMQIETANEEPELIRLLESVEAVSKLKQEKNVTRFTFLGEQKEQHQLLKLLMENNISVCRFGKIKQNMQEAYLEKIK